MFNHEDGTPKSLLSLITKLLQDSFQEIAALLSRDRKTPIKRLQDSYQDIAALLPRDYKTRVKESQHSYQEITEKHNKMIENLNFFLLCILLASTFYLYKRYLTLVKELISDLTPSSYDVPKPDSKRQKLLECVPTGNSKLCLDKAYTKDQINKLINEEVDKLFDNYEAKLSGQLVRLLGKSVINMYSMGACAALGISNQDALSEDLENDPFLNSALQRFTCELYYRFGSFLAPLSIGIITSRHYLSEHNKNGGENEDKRNSE